MFFRRRGCLLGCSVLFALCIGIGLLTWYVGIPRLTGVIEDGLSDGLATEIANEINPLYSRAELQEGQSIRFSFDSINQSLQENNSDNPADSTRVTTSGNQVVMRVELGGQEYEVGFIPRVSQEGRLEMESVEEDSWWTRQFMDVLSGGFEGGINGWLERNGLILVNVELDGDGIILTVEGE